MKGALLLFLFPLLVAEAQYDFGSVDRLLQDSLSVLGGTGADDYGGVSLLIWKDGGIIYNRSLALPGKSFHENRLVPVASASKWFSGALIMALMDRGVLTMDTEAGASFPFLTGEKARMSIRQLFSFTSGLPGNLTGPSSCVEELNYKGTLADCVNEVLKEFLVGQPGEYMSYGSNGMQVAGRMAEVASGVKLPSGACWDYLFKEYIADPMGLKRTGYDIPGIYETENP